MLKVFSPPQECGDVPEMLGMDWQGHMKEEEKYVKKVQAWARKNGSGKYKGVEVHFPQADGYARYIVQSLKPTVLIWLPVGDAWQFPYIERLTAKDIEAKIKQSIAMDKLFSGKKVVRVRKKSQLSSLRS